MSRPSATERALELARTGPVRSIADIRRALKKEGCDNVDAYLSSESLKKQLKATIAARLAEAGH